VVQKENKIMSETQLKVTGKFQATDDEGNNYTVYEYTVFHHTTTADMKYGEGADKAYKLANGSPLVKISETEFEIGLSKVRIYIRQE
jgi:hypothetical protein